MFYMRPVSVASFVRITRLSEYRHRLRLAAPARILFRYAACNSYL